MDFFASVAYSLAFVLLRWYAGNSCAQGIGEDRNKIALRASFRKRRMRLMRPPKGWKFFCPKLIMSQEVHLLNFKEAKQEF